MQNSDVEMSEAAAASGVVNARLAFDATFLLRRYFVRPTGIDRVQLEIVAELLRDGDYVDFVEFDEVHGIFRTVPTSTVAERVRAMRGEDNSANVDCPHRTGSPVRLTAGRLVAQRFKSSPDTGRHLTKAAGHARRAVQELVRAARSLRATATLNRRGEPASCASATWSGTTTFASLGMDFGRYAVYLAERRAATSAQVCLVVYDVIPIVQPQFTTIDFEPFILKILDLADHVLVISDVTRRDLESFAALRQLALPETTKLPLGSALVDIGATKPAALAGPLGVARGDFVLYVSTLTLRKNHHLLFDVWEELIREHGPDSAPKLVIAGQRGPLSAESQSRLDKTPGFEGVVFHVEEATDAEIAWLYRNCRFTVYPSLYEGWGLPVSESHDFGKVCLASDRTSLPEAGEGLAELLDPIDRTAWQERIWAVWNDEEARCEHERMIVRKHRRVTARHTTDTLLSVAGLQDSGHVGY